MPVEDHYQPKGPDDLVPADPVSIAVALADKIDTLVGFWAIDEKPTGAKDPYALRRAALGIIRIVIDNELRLPLRLPLCGTRRSTATRSWPRRKREAAGADRRAECYRH